MKSLNIAYFLSVKADYVGGADQTLFMQAVLMNAYHNVIVVLPCDRSGRINSLFQKKCKDYNLHYEVLFYDTANTMKMIDLVNCREESAAIEKFVLYNRIDILHSVQINPPVEYISRKCGIPHIMNIYSLQEWEWSIPVIDIFPCHVSCDSEFFLEKWKRYLKCSGKCVRVFSDVHIKKNKLRKKREIQFGAAGSICSYKNQLEVIKAIEMEVKRGRNVRLLLAGSDESYYADECRRYVEGHALEQYVQLSGFVENMDAFYEQIDVFICGSMRESFPASIVEAFSCNIPVISTPVAGVPEILTDRSNAYISRGYSADKLADAIENFFYDYESSRLDALLLNEAYTYKQNFSREAVTSQLTELYRGVLEKDAEKRSLSKWCAIEEKVIQMSVLLKSKLLVEDDLYRVYNRLLYFYRLKDGIRAGECYIWGAGKWGRLTRIILQSFIRNIIIKAFIDNNKEGLYDGIKIVKKEEVNIKEDTTIFISFVEGQEEAVEYLQNMGMEMLKNIIIIS